MEPVTYLKEQAVEMFGSQAKLARALGISRMAITKWEDGKPIPALRAMQIHYVLKPDLSKNTKQPRGKRGAKSNSGARS